MKSPAVQEFACALWDARERGGLATAGDLIEGLGAAIASDRATRKYDPETDQRVHWCLEMIRQRLDCPERRRPQANDDMEFWMRWSLEREERREPCGKERAAGN